MPGRVRDFLRRGARAVDVHASERYEPPKHTTVMRFCEACEAETPHSADGVCKRRNAHIREECGVCDEVTVHGKKSGACLKHEKLCAVCGKRTTWVNGACSQHVMKYCSSCNALKAFIDGTCASAKSHPRAYSTMSWGHLLGW